MKRRTKKRWLTKNLLAIVQKAFVALRKLVFVAGKNAAAKGSKNLRMGKEQCNLQPNKPTYLVIHCNPVLWIHSPVFFVLVAVTRTRRISANTLSAPE